MAGNKLLPGGFPEQSIIGQKRENVIKTLIGNNFEKYGFVNIETPAVEANEVLMAKGGDEVGKQIFGLYGLAQGAADTKKYSLHFDLTIPLARYVIDHENELKMPFKRYQMQKVWRGERQQKGRFKEFYQYDVDVIDNDLNSYYDAEVIEVLRKTIMSILVKLEVDKTVVVKINNKKIYTELFEKHGVESETATKVLAVIDAYYKYPSVEDFVTAMRAVLGDKTDDFLQSIQEVVNVFAADSDDGTPIQQETSSIIGLLKKNGVNVQYDPYIVRGLDYYDGTVFETFVVGMESMGSICSGGSYSNLVGAIREKMHKKGTSYGGVGGSIGLSRLLYVLEQEGFLEKIFSLSDVIVFNVNGDETGEDKRHETANLLRNAGIRADHYIKHDKLKKQFVYAESKNITLGIFLEDSFAEDGKLKVKNLVSRDEQYAIMEDLIDVVKGML